MPYKKRKMAGEWKYYPVCNGLVLLETDILENVSVSASIPILVSDERFRNNQ